MYTAGQSGFHGINVWRAWFALPPFFYEPRHGVEKVCRKVGNVTLCVSQVYVTKITMFIVCIAGYLIGDLALVGRLLSFRYVGQAWKL